LSLFFYLTNGICGSPSSSIVLEVFGDINLGKVIWFLCAH